MTQPLTVAMDPRVKTPPADLALQFDVAMKISAAMDEDAEALRQVRRLRAQLAALKPRAEKTGAIEAVGALDAAAAALEGGRAGRGRRNGSGTPRPNADLATLLEVVGGADARPTASTVSAVEETNRSLASLLARWNEIQTRDIPELNRKLQSAKLPVLDVSKKH
jgi:hypothetical protein